MIKKLANNNDITIYRHQHFVMIEGVQVNYVTWIAQTVDENIYVTDCNEDKQSIPENFMLSQLFNEITDRGIAIDDNELRRQIYATNH